MSKRVFLVAFTGGFPTLRAVALLIVAAAGFAFVGCSSSSDDTSSTTGMVTLRVAGS